MRARTLFVFAIAIGSLVSLPVPAGAGVPVAPGNATAEAFLPSTACSCHGPLVEQWSPSMHAQAIVDPVFLAKVAEAQSGAGVAVGVFCKRCHSPIGNMTADYDGKDGAAAGEGVTCMFCHQVIAVHGDPGNVAHILEPDLTRRAQLKDPAAPHPAEYSEIHEKAEICGGCHNVNHPTSGTHLETSYSEWAEGPYAAEGVTCQDCHMSEGAGFIGPSPGTAATDASQRDNIYAMTFVGANVGQGPADASRKLLQSAATVEMELAEIVAPSTNASFTVTITNTGAGHYLPTGLTEIRDMWLRVYAEAADGTVTELGERHFGTVLSDAEGNHPAEMWEAVAIYSDDRIPPRQAVTETYSFAMPTGAEQSTVVAVLNYRSVPDELAEKAGVENPVTEMASARTTVFASEAARDSVPAEDAPEGGSRGSENAWWPFALVAAAALVAAVVVLVRWKRRS